MKKKIGIYDIFNFFICSVSLSSLLLLSVGYFKSLWAICLGAFFTFIFFSFFSNKDRKTIAIHRPKIDLILLAILSLALFFRIRPYQYIMGGQDQGVYVNMSAYFEKEGKVFIIDQVRDKLPENLKQRYDQDNHVDPYNVITPDKYEGMQHGGVYIKNIDKSENVFQFFHLHPLWMSIFSVLFGSDNRFYSVVFFSILSIFNFYLLAKEISKKSKYSPYLASFFLAVNPLHSFFSKFPVTEMASLFFISGGMLYLIRFLKAKKKRNLYLIISSLLFWCLFFNHISGLFHFIFLFILWLIILVFNTNSKTKKSYSIFFLLTSIGLALSYIYGYIFSYPYTYHIYYYFLLKPKYIYLLSLIASILILLALCPFFKRILNKNKKNLSKLSSFGFIIAFAFAFYRGYQFSYTDKHLLSAFNKVWDIAKKGILSIPYTTINTYLLYLSPVLTISMIIFHFIIRSNILLKFLSLFISYFIVVRFFTTHAIPYQYYYTRYLLPEIVSFSLLYVSLLLNNQIQKRKNLINKILVLLIITYSASYFTYHTSFQLNGLEADGSNTSLKFISSYLDEKDILISSIKDYEIMTPLKYYFHLNYATFLDIDNEVLDHAALNYNNVYILKTERLNSNMYDLIDTISYKQGVFEHRNRIPHNFLYDKAISLYLYKLKKINFYKNLDTFLPIFSERINFYDGGFWTNGEGILTNLDYQIPQNSKYIVLKIKGYSPFSADLDALGISLSVQDTKLELAQVQDTSFYFLIPDNLKKISEITIKSNTFNPKELGASSDDRNLGVYLDSITIQ